MCVHVSRKHIKLYQIYKTNAPIVLAFVRSSFQSLLLLFNALFFLSLSLLQKHSSLVVAGIPMATLLGSLLTVFADFSYTHDGGCLCNQTVGVSTARDPPIWSFLPYSVHAKLCCLMLVSFG